MKIERTEPKDLQTVVTLTLEPADYLPEVEKELKDFRRKASIPGFRPGNVPMGLVKKMYGKSVTAEVVNKTLGQKLSEYIETEKLQVLGEPLPNEELTPAIDLDNADTFTFAFDLGLAPEFDASLNAKNKLTEYHITVTDEMVDKQVQGYADRYGESIEVEEVKEGDMLTGLLKEVGNDAAPIQKENAMLNPQYMKEKKVAKSFYGKKLGDVVTFNPMKAYDSAVEVASMLSIKKEEAENLQADFTFEIQKIRRHEAAKIDAELFAKVYGENNIADEVAFRQKVREEIEANMAQDAEYKFGLDAKEAVMKKLENVAFPDAFLKRWVLATSDKDKMDAEKLEKEYPAMLEELKWQLAKDQLMQKFEIKVEKEDVEAYAKEVARMQFMQYGLMHVEDQYLTSYAQEMLKNDQQLRGLVERVAENKVYKALKTVAKIETKEISHEDFGKLFA